MRMGSYLMTLAVVLVLPQPQQSLSILTYMEAGGNLIVLRFINPSTQNTTLFIPL